MSKYKLKKRLQPVFSKNSSPKAELKELRSELKTRLQKASHSELERKWETASEELGLWKSLFQSGKSFSSRLRSFFGQKEKTSKSLWVGLEEMLLEADLGMETTSQLLSSLRSSFSFDAKEEEVKKALGLSMLRVLEKPWPKITQPGKEPLVLLMLGVNGVGKTTALGKLAFWYKKQGKRVMLLAGDTFRAGAVSQLETWAQRSNSLFFGEPTAKNPSLVFQKGMQHALKEEAEVILCDTAGRLHTHKPLMDELKRISKIIQASVPKAPQERWLALDATQGQNGIRQARQFGQNLGVNGLLVNKLDGSAKGGVMLSLVHEFRLPVRFVGLGEGLEDLQPFHPAAFVRALLG